MMCSNFDIYYSSDVESIDGYTLSVNHNQAINFSSYDCEEFRANYQYNNKHTCSHCPIRWPYEHIGYVSCI